MTQLGLKRRTYGLCKISCSRFVGPSTSDTIILCGTLRLTNKYPCKSYFVIMKVGIRGYTLRDPSGKVPLNDCACEFKVLFFKTSESTVSFGMAQLNKEKHYVELY